MTQAVKIDVVINAKGADETANKAKKVENALNRIKGKNVNPKANLGGNALSQTKSLSSELLKLGAKVFTVQLAWKVAKSVGDFVLDSINEAGQLDTDIVMSYNVLSKNEKTQANKDLLKNSAMEQGRTSIFTSDEAAKAQTELLKAGVNVKDTIAALPAVMDAASGSGMELADTAHLLVSTMTTFGKTVDDTYEVSDRLITGANASLADVYEYGLSLKYVGGYADTLGYSLEETLTLMSMLSNAGMEGSQLGTGLKQVLNDLVKPTDAAKAEMQALGISVWDDQHKFKKMSEIMDDFNSAMDGWTDEDKMTALSEIFDSRSVEQMLKFMKQGSSEYKELLDEILGGDGVTEENANNMEQSYLGKLKLLQSAWSDLKVKFAEPLMTPVTDILDRITAKLPEITPKLQAVGEKIAKILDSPDFQRKFDETIDNISNTIVTLADALADQEMWQTAITGIQGVGKALETIATTVGPIIEFLNKTPSALVVLDKYAQLFGSEKGEKFKELFGGTEENGTKKKNSDIKLETTENPIAKIGDKVNIDVTANTTDAAAKITATSNQVIELDENDPDIIVNAQTNRAHQQLSGILSLLQTINGMAVSASVTISKSVVSVGESVVNDVVNNADKNALGTSNYKGGPTWLGENGPELAVLPRGTSIKNSRESQNSMGGNVSVNVNVNSNGDKKQLVKEVCTEVAKKLNAQL